MIDLRCGDARDVLAGMADASVDSVITDPPYALTQMSRGGSPRFNDPTKPYGRHRLADKGFMGQQWDNGRVAHDPAFWAEVLRVAKPGAFLLAFGGTRTYHRLASAVEDGGWELRDMIVHWMYASGFPKSKSCLKPSHEPIVLAKAPGPLQPLQIDACRVPTGGPRPARVAAGRTGAVYGAGLEGGYAAGVRPTTQGRWPPNTLFSHVGGPGGCQPAGVRRVPADKRGQGRPRGTFPHSDDAWGNGHRAYTGAETAGDGTEAQQDYLCVEGCAVAELDRQAGPRPSGAVSHRAGATITDNWRTSEGRTDTHRRANDNAWPATTGNASRFFPTFPGPDPEDAVPFRYCSKASRRERNAGCDGLAGTRPDAHNLSSNACATCGRRIKANGSGEKCECGPARVTIKFPPAANGHPTVKPLALMQWLCKLATPKGGVVLDCFCGSGSTGVACVREGFGFVGIDMSEDYIAIARARIAHEQERADGQLALPLGHACG